jgi:hypothetical protein
MANSLFQKATPETGPCQTETLRKLKIDYEFDASKTPKSSPGRGRTQELRLLGGKDRWQGGSWKRNDKVAADANEEKRNEVKGGYKVILT